MGADPGDVPLRLDPALHRSPETASPGGETVRNRPGEIEPEESRRARLQSRINAWIDDDSASRRVEKGLVDDCLAGSTALDHALQEHPPPASLAPSPLTTLVRRCRRRGCPLRRNRKPERLGESDRSLLERRPRPLAQALGPANTFQLQTEGNANDLAVIELSYDLEGKGLRLLRSSGSREFNLHVLNVVAPRAAWLAGHAGRWSGDSSRRHLQHLARSRARDLRARHAQARSRTMPVSADRSGDQHPEWSLRRDHRLRRVPGFSQDAHPLRGRAPSGSLRCHDKTFHHRRRSHGEPAWASGPCGSPARAVWGPSNESHRGPRSAETARSSWG